MNRDLRILIASSLKPRFLLIASSDFEANQGGTEEAMRRNWDEGAKSGDWSSKNT
jgi:hypothetical protein